jgi:predicted PurR-regulated permease PerM
LWEAIRYTVRMPEVQKAFNVSNARDMLISLSKKVLPGLWGLILAAGSMVVGLFGLFIIILYMVFLLLDFPSVQAGWPGLIPHKYRTQVMEFVDDAESALATYFRGQAAVASIVGLLFAIGFFIISLPMGIVLGLFIGLLNMVPYLQLIALIPAFFLAALHTLESGTDFWTYLMLTGGVFVVVQLIQDAVLVPRIMGKATGLSPAIILLSLSVWGKLLGFLGLLLAIPLTVLGWAYYNRYLSKAPSPQPDDSA